MSHLPELWILYLRLGDRMTRDIAELRAELERLAENLDGTVDIPEELWDAISLALLERDRSEDEEDESSG